MQCKFHCCLRNNMSTDDCILSNSIRMVLNSSSIITSYILPTFQKILNAMVLREIKLPFNSKAIYKLPCFTSNKSNAPICYGILWHWGFIKTTDHRPTDQRPTDHFPLTYRLIDLRHQLTLKQKARF